MAQMTFRSDEFRALPSFLKTYASYESTVRANSEKTICEYLLDLRTFFRFMVMRRGGVELEREDFEKLNISSLTMDDAAGVTFDFIIDFLTYTNFERRNNPTTRNRKLSSLKSFYKYACDKKHYIDHNPTTTIDCLKMSKTLPKYLTLEEAMRLLQTVSSDKESKTRARDYSIIALFLNTGMRLSELVGLNLESFDPKLTFVKVLGKGNKERVIYLNDAARDAVRSYLRVRLDPRYISTSEHALFISQRQVRISNKTVQYIVYKYLNMAGLGSKGLSVHKLRHTAATLMYQSGNVDIRVLKEILGHEQLNTTQIYTHVVNENMEKAMQNNPLAKITQKNVSSNEEDD